MSAFLDGLLNIVIMVVLLGLFVGFVSSVWHLGSGRSRYRRDRTRR